MQSAKGRQTCKNANKVSHLLLSPLSISLLKSKAVIWCYYAIVAVTFIASPTNYEGLRIEGPNFPPHLSREGPWPLRAPTDATDEYAAGQIGRIVACTAMAQLG